MLSCSYNEEISTFGSNGFCSVCFCNDDKPVFAASSNLKIASVDGFSMTVKGGHPGTVEDVTPLWFMISLLTKPDQKIPWYHI